MSDITKLGCRMKFNSTFLMANTCIVGHISGGLTDVDLDGGRNRMILETVGKARDKLKTTQRTVPGFLSKVIGLK